MSKNTIPNIWTAQEKVIHLYKSLSIGLGILCLVMMLGLAANYFQNPLVVVAKSHEAEFYPSQRKRVPLEKAEVEGFTKQFLANLYVWG